MATSSTCMNMFVLLTETPEKMSSSSVLAESILVSKRFFVTCCATSSIPLIPLKILQLSSSFIVLDGTCSFDSTSVIPLDKVETPLMFFNESA